MVSFPDELLARVDAEASRRGTSRSGLLQLAAQREIGSLAMPREEILARLDRVAGGWQAPLDLTAELRSDRQRLVGS